jgi:hypothetical protein
MVVFRLPQTICSDLRTKSSERPPFGRPSVIITDENNHLQYFHGSECDRQGDNQGIHDHLGVIQNEFLDLADYILSSCSAQGPVCWRSRVVSRLSPGKAPDHPPIPPTVTGKASPRLSAHPQSVDTPSTYPTVSDSLSSAISFLSFYHSDDFSFMESEPFVQQTPLSFIAHRHR